MEFWCEPGPREQATRQEPVPKPGNEYPHVLSSHPLPFPVGWHLPWAKPSWKPEGKYALCCVPAREVSFPQPRVSGEAQSKSGGRGGGAGTGDVLPWSAVH